MLGRVKLDNILLTCGRVNFNQITARSRNGTLVIVVRDTCTTIVPSAPHVRIISLDNEYIPGTELSNGSIAYVKNNDPSCSIYKETVLKRCRLLECL